MRVGVKKSSVKLRYKSSVTISVTKREKIKGEKISVTVTLQVKKVKVKKGGEQKIKNEKKIETEYL